MLRRLRLLVLPAIVIGLAFSGQLFGQSAPVADEFGSLHFRSIGPASMSGRITDFAVYEPDPATYYVATAHGGTVGGANRPQGGAAVWFSIPIRPPGE